MIFGCMNTIDLITVENNLRGILRDTTSFILFIGLNIRLELPFCATCPLHFKQTVRVHTSPTVWSA